MLDPNLKQILAQGYAKLGDISYSIALNMRKGKDHVISQRELKEQGIKMRLLLGVLFRHVTFDDTTDLPILWRVTEVQVNKFVRCLVTIGELNKYPIVPTLFPNVKPLIVNTGTQGAPGIGTDGTDANIIVQAKAGEDQIIVESTVVAGVKTYDLSFVTYVKQLLTAVVQGSKIFEIGSSHNIAILITSTKGTKTILTITSPDGPIDLILQPLLNFTDINNGLIQPVNTVLNLTGRLVNETYQFTSNDAKNLVIASDSINFYYPFLCGAANTILTTTHYSTLTKIINAKANYDITFADADKYFYIAYPSSYGALTKIFDENGFNVTSSFTGGDLINVSSSGLVNNWIVEYRVYRTLLKTTINGTYKIQF